MSSITQKVDSVIGCLLGTAVGDALGLPYEGLSKQRQRKIYSRIDRHRFCFGKGMISDDTEHTCMVAQALIVSGGERAKFARSLAWQFRFWLLSLPVNLGLATLKAILKLWLGFSPDRSGVFSAGNGPAMRSAIIGVCYGDNLEKMRELVKVSARITHTDPKAEWGALAVAIAARFATNQSKVSPETYSQFMTEILPPEAPEFLELIELACESAIKQQSAELFALDLGLNQGVTGYVYHTVPVVIQIWLRHQTDYATAIQEVIRLGGDTDSTAAILGGIIGASVGKVGFPQQWLRDLWEFPKSREWLENLGRKLAEVRVSGRRQKPLSLLPDAIFLRNLFFLFVVILHGLRRLLPPY
ncbi:ADP-ribosylglycohydrolase family protein [Oscillatoria salina]|uniref:ADP-ribosylglycohydrolase family protein n=1 Tax=Oscillatoria salina TaxID=331517 RepID=UPI001CCD2E46|nr:ADP-ribosylglycohydrolase family protein [Oscillatoria salina]